MNQCNQKIDKQQRNKVINAGACQNKQLQSYINDKVEQAQEELDKIDNDIKNLEQS